MQSKLIGQKLQKKCKRTRKKYNTRIENQLYRSCIKRVLDIILSFLGIVVLSPVIVGTAVLVKIKLGSPVIFKQRRPGKNEEIFEMYKFRSMTNQRDEKGELLPDDERMTEFGKKLRRTSFDELPELFNILKGDMSIVGPRPQLIKDMLFMTSEQRKRHMVLPGLTGLAQINGRNHITWEEKLNWDLKYIERISLRTDLVIIFRTVLEVLKKENITAEGMETAEDLGDYLLKTGKISKSTYNMKIQILRGEKWND